MRLAMKRLALPISVILALTACSSTNTQSAENEPVTISYMNFTSNGGNEKNLETIIDAFEKENPGIKVDVSTLPYSDYFTTLQTDLAGGTVADVFDIEYANYGAYQASGILAPLDVDISIYQRSLAEAYTTDGTAYALPTSFSNVVMFYNKDLFDAAGIDYPTAEWTWEDERAAAEAITDKAAGIWGDYQPITYNEYYKALAQNSGTLFNKDNTTATFNNPEGIEAAKWLVEKSGTVMPTAEQGAGTPDFDTNLFAEGKLAMWHTGIWMFGAIADAPFEWDIVVEPGNTESASAMFSNGVAVSATTKHKEAAQSFAQFLASSETTVSVRLDAGWELPTIADQERLSPYLEVTPPASKQVVFDALEKVVLAPSIGDSQAKMQDIITDELSEAAAGRISAEEAISSAEERVNELLK